MARKMAGGRFGDRRGSMVLLDTAEELVSSMENVSVCLRHIEERYIEEGVGDQGQVIDKETSLYRKLKENLEAARDMTETLKREKWRLSRREMSVELRMGELDDYKLHLKRDMSDMNETVESLSMRVIQLEDALCEAQEIQETLEADKAELQTHLHDAGDKSKEVERQNQDLISQLKRKSLHRQDSRIQKENVELFSELDMLRLENESLKEMIREKDEATENIENNPPTSNLDDLEISASNEHAQMRRSSSSASTDSATQTELTTSTKIVEIAYV